MKNTVRGAALEASATSLVDDPYALSILVVAFTIVIAVVKALGVGGADGARGGGVRRPAVHDIFADPSSVNRRLMRAESSAGVSAAAAKFVKVVRVHLLGRSPLLTRTEFNDQSIEDYVWRLCQAAANGLVPINCNDDMTPSSDSSRVVSPTSIVLYIGQHLQLLKLVFPEDDAWNGLGAKELPEWWTACRGDTFQTASNYQMRNAPDGIYNRKNRPVYPTCCGRDDDPNSFCSTDRMIQRLYSGANQSNNNIEDAVIIGHTADSVNRGGESKFCNLSRWEWDPKFLIVDTPQTQSKTTKMKGCPRAPHENPYLDWYFQNGVWALCNGGLRRTEEDRSHGRQNFTYPFLQKISDSSVTTKVTNAMRRAVKRIVSALGFTMSDDDVNKYSAKSLRAGDIGVLSWCSGISTIQICRRSGHSTDTTLDSYIDWSDPVPGIAAMNVLHGRAPESRVVLPDLDVVAAGFEADLVDALLDEMFSTNIDEFKKNGHLYPVLKQFAAAVIRHQARLVKDCGNENYITAKLVEVVDRMRRGGRFFREYAALSSFTLIQQMAKRIEDKYTASSRLEAKRVSGINSSSGDTRDMIVAEDVKKLMEDKDQLMLEVVNAKSSLALRDARIRLLEDELEKARGKIEHLSANGISVRTPSKRTRADSEESQPPPTRARTQQSQSSSTSNFLSSTNRDGAQGSPSQSPQQGAPLGPRVSSRTIVQAPPVPPRTAERPVNSALTPMSTAPVSDANLTIRHWLLNNVSVNLNAIRSSTATVSDRRNTSLAKYVLELAHYISETDSAVESCFKTLKESQSLSDKQHAAERIESALWLKMLELEEKTVQYNESRRKSCEKKFIGFGTRVRDYKKRIAMTMDKVPPKYNYPLVTLIGLEDLKRREQQQRTQMEETQMEEETQTDETRTEDTQAEATQRGATQRGAQVQGVRPLSDFGFNGDARQMNVERIARGFAERQQQQSKNAC